MYLSVSLALLVALPSHCLLLVMRCSYRSHVVKLYMEVCMEYRSYHKKRTTSSSERFNQVHTYLAQ